MSGMTPNEAHVKCGGILARAIRGILTPKEAHDKLGEVLLELHETSFSDGVDKGLRMERPQDKVINQICEDAINSIDETLDNSVSPVSFVYKTETCSVCSMETNHGYYFTSGDRYEQKFVCSLSCRKVYFGEDPLEFVGEEKNRAIWEPMVSGPEAIDGIVLP